MNFCVSELINCSKKSPKQFTLDEDGFDKLSMIFVSDVIINSYTCFSGAKKWILVLIFFPCTKNNILFHEAQINSPKKVILKFKNNIQIAVRVFSLTTCCDLLLESQFWFSTSENKLEYFTLWNKWAGAVKP